MLAFYIDGVRGGLLWSIPAVGFYWWTTASTHYDLAAMRVIQTSAVVLIAGFLVPRVLARAREADVANERLSGIDPVTTIANVRRLTLRLEDELARTRTVGGYVTVMMIDLDDFKQVNDRYSHKHGDRTLAAVARAIERVVGPQDLAARRGGDEFVAVLPHDGDLQPELIAERLLAEIRAAREEICPDLNSNASIGYVTSEAGDSVAELIERADAREKLVKQSHRGGQPALRALQSVA
ncbi:MAG: GGDEF domain-containing protein, partial [Solirubrobacterales bacterium]